MQDFVRFSVLNNRCFGTERLKFRKYSMSEILNDEINLILVNSDEISVRLTDLMIVSSKKEYILELI